MLEVKLYKSSIKGMAIGFIGAIHGNETCGTKAINKLIDDIEAGRVNLDAGAIYCLPIANPEAYKKGVRFCDVNLNRVFKKIESPKLYEEKIVQEVMAFIDACDVIIDLHSNHTSGIPFVFQDSVDDKTTALINALPVGLVMQGWMELYGATDDVSSTEYACKKGKCALTIECGEHSDPKAVDVAYNSIINTLRYFNMIETSALPNIEKQYMTLSSFTKKPKGGKFTREWSHGDKIAKDEIIGSDEAGNIYKSDIDGFISLPFAKAEEGSEWYYLAKQVLSL